MISHEKLNQLADDFLRSSDQIYSECAGGIALVEKILVSVASGHADHARCYMVTILYAYWERYFRSIFGEFLRTSASAGLQVLHLNDNLIELRLKELFNEFSKAEQISHFSNLSVPSKFTNLQDSHRKWTQDPVAFDSPTEWIRTYSNVEFNVLKEACDCVGLNIENLKIKLDDSSVTLFPRLKELVDERNNIAHGSVIKPCSQDDWERLKELVLNLMNVLQLEMDESIRGGTFLNVSLRSSAVAAVDPVEVDLQ